MSKKLFDFCIGNPPYNADFNNSGENGNFAQPVYNDFMDAANKVAEKVELIHPARFLFNAGSTPKTWNEKMLNDPSFKVLHYESDAKKVFPNTEIKGGIAITYHDDSSNFGAIKIFTAYEELNTILHKVQPYAEKANLSSIMYNQMRFNLDSLYNSNPELCNVIGSNGKDKRFRNNIFDKIPLFTEAKTSEDDVAVFGVIKNKRLWRWFPKKFIDMSHENINQWKVLVARVNGNGVFGETLSTPLVEKPMEAYTQTFIGIGSFETENEANAALKFIKTKLARTMLGVLKITQDNSIETWRMIPLQNFTSESDIDWSKSIHEIDLQLYRKYNLSKEEIDFIETNVKEME